MIPFHQPYQTGNEQRYLAEVLSSGKWSGNGVFTRKCHQFFQQRYGFEHCLLTSSCTDALEMVGILLDLKEGDEVIVPSYGFVSSANAFALRGATIVFADSTPNHPNIDVQQVEQCITPRTKAVVVIHYAGMCCDMDALLRLRDAHGFALIEDAAQCIDAFQGDQPLGSLGDFATFSFHDTKNISCGEGGLLVINDPKYVKRAEVIWEKGTNRAAFHRKEVAEYSWRDVGSSFLPSELTAAVLWAQLEQLPDITRTRKQHWDRYYQQLASVVPSAGISLPSVPIAAVHNGHIFYLVCAHKTQRDELISFLGKEGIQACFHYLPLHDSPYYVQHHTVVHCEHASHFGSCLVRLPLYYEMTIREIDAVCNAVERFCATQG